MSGSPRLRGRRKASRARTDEATRCDRCGTERVAHFRYCRVCGNDFEPVHAVLPTFQRLGEDGTRHEGVAAPVVTVAAPPAPSAVGVPIAAARRLADGTRVTITGVLTTVLGNLDGHRGGFVQDTSGAIGLYLDRPVRGTWAAGTTVVIAGRLARRHGLLVIRLDEDAIERGPVAALPPTTRIATGAAGPLNEATRVKVVGTRRGRLIHPSQGLGVSVDDGSGPILVIIGPKALRGRTIPPGTVVSVSGPLGLRARSNAGTSGYRIHATLVGDLQIVSPTRGAVVAPDPVVADGPGVGAVPSDRSPSYPGPWVASPAAPTTALALGPPTAGRSVSRAAALGRTRSPRPLTAATAMTAATAPRTAPPVTPTPDPPPPAYRLATPTVTRWTLLGAAIVAVILGEGDLLTTAGVLGGVALLALLAYRELHWAIAD